MTEESPSSPQRSIVRLWKPVLITLATVALAVAGVSQYREHKAQLMLASTQAELVRVSEIQDRLAAGKLPLPEAETGLRTAEKFLNEHPDGEPLAEFSEIRLQMAAAWISMENWQAAGEVLDKVRSLSLNGQTAKSVCAAHLLIAESAAPYPHLKEFTKLALVSSDYALQKTADAEKNQPAGIKLKQRQATCQATLAAHFAQAEWLKEEARRREVSKATQAQAKKLSADLQKEMKDAFAKVNLDIKAATDANNPDGVAAALQAKVTLQQNFADTLAKREAQLREQLLKESTPTAEIIASQDAWCTAAEQAAALAPAGSLDQILSLSQLLDAQNSRQIWPKAQPTAQQLEKLTKERLTIDPENQAAKQAASKAYLHLAEYALVRSQEEAAEAKNKWLGEAEKYATEAKTLADGNSPFLQRIVGTLTTVLQMADRGPDASKILTDSVAMLSQAPASQADLLLRVNALTRQKATLHRLTRKPEQTAAELETAQKLQTAVQAWHTSLISSRLMAQDNSNLKTQSDEAVNLCGILLETKPWAGVILAQAGK